jgi:hypothetical protein
MHFCARCSILSYTRCNSAVSIHRIDTLHFHSFNFLYTVRDLGPRWSTRRRPVFRAPSCMSIYVYKFFFLFLIKRHLYLLLYYILQFFLLNFKISCSWSGKDDTHVFCYMKAVTDSLEKGVDSIFLVLRKTQTWHSSYKLHCRHICNCLFINFKMQFPWMILRNICTSHSCRISKIFLQNLIHYRCQTEKLTKLFAWPGSFLLLD